jgi:hypothetical protein
MYTEAFSTTSYTCHRNIVYRILQLKLLLTWYCGPIFIVLTSFKQLSHFTFTSI